ncbi:ABC transporter permease [Chitinophaga sp. GCM10012297]|uniref:ABC transporter permease n=1 Tax=Chitinophaga chungangae TaxID=2821488 RepID=A0ABS3YDB2_9BACT|nr:ABC transporter permease [Chitinophaga chungangae]MBO9152682.1 ABC transporter permease [Chitinophaga chungangae]
MIRNYFKIALRNLWKHKTNTFINLLGLTVAFTICLLLLLSVYFEFSFNKFHYQPHNLYRAYFKVQLPENPSLQPSMPEPLLKELKSQFPAVQAGTRYNRNGCEIEYNGKHFFNDQFAFVDPDFFTMFSFPLEKGNASQALAGLDNIVLSHATAAAIFGNEDPVGKQLRVQSGGPWKVFTVSGVAAEVPATSSIDFDAVARFEHGFTYAPTIGKWDATNHDVIIRLKEGADVKTFEKAVQGLINLQYKDYISDLKRDGARPAPNGQYMELLMQPYLDMHTDTSMRGVGDTISRSYLYMLLSVAILVMFIACINFVNLSVGRSFTRSREVGLRKTLGAMPLQVGMQFWGEAAIICGLALCISVPLFYFLLPHYKAIFGSSLDTGVLLQPGIIAAVIGAFLLVTVLAGGYPALVMIRMNAVHILKGKLKLKTSGGLRNGLIIGQFSIAILLIGCTLIAWQQLNFLRARPLGYNSSQVVSIPVGQEVDGREALELLRQKLNAEPSVLSVSGLSKNMGVGIDGSSYTYSVGFDYKNRTVTMEWLNVGYDFTKTMELSMAAGRDFSRNFTTDSTGIVINEQMARKMGVKDAVGEVFQVEELGLGLKVIGVVKDFNFQSLHRPVEPMGLVMNKEMPINYLLVKVRPDNLPGIMNKLKTTWAQIAPRSEFRGSFLDENIDRQYNREEKFTQIFVYAAVVAIVLSCLGLFALAVLAIMQRTREIGIRKALGASTGSIVQLITKDFVKLIVVAMIIATPLAWYFMSIWLKDFAFSVRIQWWWLLAAGLMALAVALCTIGYQSLKAAFANPVKSLKTE